MINTLNASSHKNNFSFYEIEFENLLYKIILCYKIMLYDNIELENNENKIRDVLLLEYLNNNKIRNKIEFNDFIFNREVPEDCTIGRTDIKIQTKNSFIDTQAYYIIECKRLNNANLKGKTGLNSEYIKNGIMRFTKNYYSSYYKTNGMIGFVVENLNIDGNIKNINSLINKYSEELNYINLMNNFKYSYLSIHIDSKGKEIKLYHLMLDFSHNTI